MDKPDIKECARCVYLGGAYKTKYCQHLLQTGKRRKKAEDGTCLSRKTKRGRKKKVT